MKIMVTGGAGFIGSNFILQLLETDPQIEILNFDALTYAGNLDNLSAVEKDPRYSFFKGDICSKEDVASAMAANFDAVVHFAAESHVDRSLEEPDLFLKTNILGTQILLDRAKEIGLGRFVMVSTDEVYGSLGAEGAFSETTPLAPNSPYSASKASADMLCRAYHHTFAMDIATTRCSNNYGPLQFPEKLIPLIIANALEDKDLPVYGDGKNIRDWLYVRDHCTAIEAVLRKGKAGSIYNIGGNSEKENIEVVKTLLDTLGKPHSLIKYVTDRPGHDLRYAIDATLIREELGWEPSVSFETGIADTVNWYTANGAWLEKIRSGSYKEYYDRMYGGR